MEKFIPREKRSKKAQRSQNLKQRRTWGALRPVTRKPESPKAYHRKKVQHGDDFFHLPVEPFYCPVLDCGAPCAKNLNNIILVNI